MDGSDRESDFEPLEMPLGDGGAHRQPKGKTVANAYGRECLVPLLREATDIRRWVTEVSPSECFSLVEVGSWAGGNALEIVEGVEHAIVHCIDTFEGGMDVTQIIARRLT